MVPVGILKLKYITFRRELQISISLGVRKLVNITLYQVLMAIANSGRKRRKESQHLQTSFGFTITSFTTKRIKQLIELRLWHWWWEILRFTCSFIFQCVVKFMMVLVSRYHTQLVLIKSEGPAGWFPKKSEMMLILRKRHTGLTHASCWWWQVRRSLRLCMRLWMNGFRKGPSQILPSWVRRRDIVWQTCVVSHDCGRVIR